MKITAKTTKEQLKNFLGANARAVKEQSKELYDRLVYADKMAQKDDSKVQRKDLVDLAKEVISLLGSAVVTPAMAEEPLATVEPVAENSVKKLAKGVSKKQKSMEEESSDVEGSEETAEAPTEEKVETKSAKKSSGSKKATKKEDSVTVLEGTDSQKTVQMAKSFPQTIEDEEGVKYALATDIKTMEDLYNALANDEDIVFAYYWTKRHLKQFDYFGGWLGQPKSFSSDLDLATVVYASEHRKVSYQVSMYTEAVYTILPTDFEEVDGIRVAGGIEYQIYRAV